MDIKKWLILSVLIFAVGVQAEEDTVKPAVEDAAKNSGKDADLPTQLDTPIEKKAIEKKESEKVVQAGELIAEKLDINDAVKDALNIARRDGYKEFIQKLQLEQNMPAVLANRIHIQKVLVNLLKNAVEAMRTTSAHNPAITISVRNNKEMNMAHVTVQDTGYGLDNETAKRIFEPFFTTKPTGIGMGLSVSRALVEANGGQLWLEARKKPGATFHFTLPFAP